MNHLPAFPACPFPGEIFLHETELGHVRSLDYIHSLVSEIHHRLSSLCVCRPFEQALSVRIACFHEVRPVRVHLFAEIGILLRHRSPAMPEYEFHLGRMICPARFRILHAENAAFRIVAVEIVDIYLPLAGLFLEPSPGIRRPCKGCFPEYVAQRAVSLFVA